MHSTRGMNWIWLATRLAIYARDRFDCVWCRQVFPLSEDGYGLSLDHLEGPSNAPENLVTCCFSCNSSRQETPLKTWLRGRPDRRARMCAAVARPLDRELGRRLVRARQAGIPFSRILQAQGKLL